MRKLQGVLEKDHLTVSVLKCVISNHKQSSLNFCILRIVDQKIAGLDNELRKYKEQLKKATGATAASIKKRAMDVLKRKKMYENQRDQLQNQQFNIDQTSFAIETVRSTQVTVSAMKVAAKTLKKENKKISLAEIEDMQDEMEGKAEERIAILLHITSLLSKQFVPTRRPP